MWDLNRSWELDTSWEVATQEQNLEQVSIEFKLKGQKNPVEVDITSKKLRKKVALLLKEGIDPDIANDSVREIVEHFKDRCAKWTGYEWAKVKKVTVKAWWEEATYSMKEIKDK